MSFLTLNETSKTDSNPVSRIIATEQWPQDSNNERSRASPQTLDVESSLRPSSKKHSHPGCMSSLSPSTSQSAPGANCPSSGPHSFSPPYQPIDQRSAR